MFCVLQVLHTRGMDKDKARYAHRQRRRSHSRSRDTPESTSTTRATKRDRPRTGRRPLSPRLHRFAQRLARRHSASFTRRSPYLTPGATTEQAVHSATSNPDAARSSAAPQARECREQSTASATRGSTPQCRLDKRKKTCEECGAVMYTRNWTRHLERCHVDTGIRATSDVKDEEEPRVVATATQGSSRRARAEIACTRSARRRCISLVYPLECLDVPVGVQTSCTRKRQAGISAHDQWVCVNSVNILMTKMRSEMSAALPLVESQHFARPRFAPTQQDPGAGSETSEHVQTRADVHSAPVILHDTLHIAETESLLSTEEPGELLQSVMAKPDLPQLTGEEVTLHLPSTSETMVKERTIPLNIIKERYSVKQATKQPATQLASCTSTESLLVEHTRGSNTQSKPAAQGAAVSSPRVAGTSKSSQPVQSRATAAQHVPESSQVTSYRVTSTATHTESRQAHREERGNSRPRHAARSTRSRTPARQRYGHTRRDARWEHDSRSPARKEHRATPRPSPGRRAPLERGRDESRHDDRHATEPEQMSNEGMNRLFSAFVNFMNQTHDKPVTEEQHR